MLFSYPYTHIFPSLILVKNFQVVLIFLYTPFCQPYFSKEFACCSHILIHTFFPAIFYWRICMLFSYAIHTSYLAIFWYKNFMLFSYSYTHLFPSHILLKNFHVVLIFLYTPFSQPCFSKEFACCSHIHIHTFFPAIF